MPFESVAAEVRNCPGDTATGRMTLIVALLPTVVTEVDPRKVWPSPLPEGSHDVFEKNSTVKGALAVLLSDP